MGRNYSNIANVTKLSQRGVVLKDIREYTLEKSDFNVTNARRLSHIGIVL